MSLKLIMADSSDFNNFANKIKSETGVTISINAANTYWNSVQFPDEVSIVPSTSTSVTNSVYNHAFVDVDNHLFIYDKTNIDESNIGPMSYPKYDVFISDTTDGRTISLPYVEYQCNKLFNIPSYAAHDASKQSITIFPCYYGYSSDYSGFLKNIYINYERRFVAGLKFIDQNGNRFMTLGGYLLYKVN